MSNITQRSIEAVMVRILSVTTVVKWDTTNLNVKRRNMMIKTESKGTIREITTIGITRGTAEVVTAGEATEATEVTGMVISIVTQQIINRDTNLTLDSDIIKIIEGMVNQIITQGTGVMLVMGCTTGTTTNQAKIMLVDREPYRRNATTVEDHGM